MIDLEKIDGFTISLDHTHVDYTRTNFSRFDQLFLLGSHRGRLEFAKMFKLIRVYFGNSVDNLYTVCHVLGAVPLSWRRLSLLAISVSELG